MCSPFCWRLFNLLSQKFVEFPQVYYSLNRCTASDKSIKKYIQGEQSKKEPDKNPTRPEVSFISELLNRRKRQEKF